MTPRLVAVRSMEPRWPLSVLHRRRGRTPPPPLFPAFSVAVVLTLLFLSNVFIFVGTIFALTIAVAVGVLLAPANLLS